MTEHRACILIAEDDMYNQILLEEFCHSLGWETETVGDGQACVEVVSKKGDTFSLILMDIHMPKKSGIEATLDIRAMADEKVKALPIFAVTADTTDENRKACIGAGCSEVLTKPVDINALSDLAHKFL